MIRKISAASIILILFSVCIFSFKEKSINYQQQPNQKQKLKKIVIDAGHGGKDFGAGGKFSHEKNVSLAVALKLQEVLEKEIPDVEIYMTRTTDVYESVTTKAEKANAAKGDLFISIHCNSADPYRHRELVGYKTVTHKNKKTKKTTTKKVPQYRYYSSPNPAKGTETYIWAIKKTSQKTGALKNNEDLYIDSTTSKELKDFNPDDPEMEIILNLKTKQYFDRSARLALTIEEEFVKTGRPSRQAQQRGKGIWVLQAVAMPAVLVEIGFISNPDEEEYINSQSGQEEITRALVNAIKRYKNTLETTGIKPGSTPTQK
ncbi:MAG: hypothetical protein AMXMBFR79_01490 [Chitinophagaceae bacterium]